MFDVIWTDPKRELVGERMQRKEKEKSRDKERKKLDGERQSISTYDSSSSERGLGLLSTKSQRKTPTPSRAKSTTTSPGQPIDDDVKGNRNSEYGVKSLVSGRDELESTTKPVDGPLLSPIQLPEAGDASPDPSSRDSTFSKWTQQSAATTGILAGGSVRNSTTTTKSEHLIQTLGPSSFITKSTEVTVSPRTPGASADQSESEVHISSERIKAETPPLPEPPEGATPVAFEEPVPLLSPSRLPRTPPPIEFRNSAAIYTPGWNSHDRVGSPDAWKPPHEWDCTPTKESVAPLYEDDLPLSPSSQGSDHYLSPDLAALQREIRMMSAAGPELMLANMKSAMGEVSDASIYKEIEMNKKRWMFSALHQNSSYGEFINRASAQAGSQTARKPPKILALYETQASASFLAALNPQTFMSHLSPHPISPNLFPNVRPLLVPSVSSIAGSRPLPPNLYSAVTCLSMPALFPSTEIPPFLRHINRCLRTGGALHLTLIDPQPVSASMGPKLRQWLFDRLLINLEQMFRTTYPSGTFPAWLAVARLRGKGSTIATVPVPAVLEYFTKVGGNKEQASTKAEVRCLATRMLWQEIWGSFVHAEQWWWDEEEIVQECIELETYWNYSHIIAVKEDR